MESLTIGRVARLAEVGVETIRFYERQGLIQEPPRRESGYRQYPKDTIQRVRFIKRAKDLGFTLKEIRELLVLGFLSRKASSLSTRSRPRNQGDMHGKSDLLLLQLHRFRHRKRCQAKR
jgi:MerR family copper efflux transcriptional regulator